MAWPAWLIILAVIGSAFVFSYLLVAVAAVAALFKTPQDTFDVNIKDKKDNII